jgi:hypothetical protein
VRFLTAPGQPRAELIQAMGRVLIELCERNGLSSIHVNFCRPDEVEALRPLGFLERMGMQYHWENQGFATFEDYLAAFRSKRRTQIRRERREMSDQGVSLRVLGGEAIDPAIGPTMYRLYKEHIDKLYWGRLYLTPAFYELIIRRFRRNLRFVVAEQEGEVIAGTFNVEKSGVFYGRYWGASREVRHLHFNVCYYAAVEHCIEAGLLRFEPGAGGDFKQVRGFDPRPTRSMHYFSHEGLRDAVARFLEHERARMGQIIDHLNEHSQLRHAGGKP